ncbi:MAG: branched-chain amino acid ABC transporter permease [Herpetosiphon sp.]
MDTLLHLNYLQILISGLAIGAIYALVAQGFYITYNTTTTLNFAQGDLMMLGAMAGLSGYLGATFFPAFGFKTSVRGIGALFGLANPLGSFLLALPVLLVVVILMGMGVYYFAIRPLRQFTAIGWIMSTVGLSAIIRNLALLTWGKSGLSFPSPIGNEVVRFTPTTGVYRQEILNLVVSLVVVGLLLLFLKNSTTGKAMSAVANNRDAAALMGINVRRMVVFAYVLAALCAGIGGVLIAPVVGTYVEMGVTLGLKAFAAAIVGGLVNPGGILIGGLLIGIVEQFAGGINPDLRDGTVFGLVILLLAVRPQGLFGRALIRKY